MQLIAETDNKNVNGIVNENQLENAIINDENIKDEIQHHNYMVEKRYLNLTDGIIM